MTHPFEYEQAPSTCPENCPFLAMRTWLPKTLPFYCEKYETYLGATKLRRVERCAQCRGCTPEIVPTGLSLIEAYTPGLPIFEIQQAFLELSLPYQEMFVQFISRTGREVVLSYGEPFTADTLSARLLETWRDVREAWGSPEVVEFSELMTAASADVPLLTKGTQNLLLNLFQVLDNSEKEMMRNVMQSSQRAQAFLEKFKSQPKDNDLLKNTRHLLYDAEQKRREEEKRLQQQAVLQAQQQQTQTAFIRQKLHEKGGR